MVQSVACRRPQGPASGAQQPRQILEGFTLRQSKQGQTAWALSARLAVLDERSRVVSLTEPRLEFYRDKKIVSRARSHKGTADLGTQDVRMTSAVLVDSLEDGATLATEELAYDSTRRKITTQREVLLRRPGMSLKGQGMEADPQLSEVRIFRQKTVLENQ